jgi:hypothetical protein
MLHLLLCGLRRTPPEPVAKGLQLTAIVTTQPSVCAMPEQRGACVKEMGDNGSGSQKMSTSSEDTVVDDQVHWLGYICQGSRSNCTYYSRSSKMSEDPTNATFPHCPTQTRMSARIFSHSPLSTHTGVLQLNSPITLTPRLERWTGKMLCIGWGDSGERVRLQHGCRHLFFTDHTFAQNTGPVPATQSSSIRKDSTVSDTVSFTSRAFTVTHPHYSIAEQALPFQKCEP